MWAPNAARGLGRRRLQRLEAGHAPVRRRAAGRGSGRGRVAGVGAGERYKFHIRSRAHHYEVDKADPFAFFAEVPPRTASVVWDLGYTWSDAAWMASRARRATPTTRRCSIYEVHLGSWRHAVGEHRSLSYREIAEPLVRYVTDTGFTHVELLPVMEHPFYGSWGYQTTGYFAPTSRYGAPGDLMELIDALHQHGIGVILDWVPSHFPTDEHGLGFFDGTHLFEHADPRRASTPTGTASSSTTTATRCAASCSSSASIWLDRYHADGLRVDAVASMLYLDYSRKAGEWVPERARGQREPRRARASSSRSTRRCTPTFPDVAS